MRVRWHGGSAAHQRLERRQGVASLIGHAPGMFDYDARPATPSVVLFGSRSSADAYAIRDFLTRNGQPYEWVDLDGDAGADGRLDPSDRDPSRLPLCILPDGTRLSRPTVQQVASGLGMVTAPALAEYDVAIVGAGPAGLGAATYAASEGLRTVAVEAVAPGGQAGTTSRIENYLGFPQGISGSELATRARQQAQRFGAEILLARTLAGLEAGGTEYALVLSDGARIRARALVVATGVEWRRLEVPGLDALLGAGVYYGAGPSEAVGCRDSHVVIVGGGNSAGQAAVRFSNYARSVTLLVRGADIRASMSQYLVDHVASIENIDVRTGSRVVGFEADAQLRALVVSEGDADGTRMPADALFICIGGTPRSRGPAELGARLDGGRYLVTGSDLLTASGAPEDWPLRRQPLPLETNLPGVFAAGDVRSGSVKRCAAAIGEGAMAVALVHRRLAETGDE